MIISVPIIYVVHEKWTQAQKDNFDHLIEPDLVPESKMYLNP